MRIGFYAPMKPADHPVPSGDRQMAGLLMAGLSGAGHSVEVLSRLRCFLPAPDALREVALAGAADAEVARVASAWRDPSARPDLVFAYHLHYKAPDLVGLPLARRFALPYLTAEASYARKREGGPWAARQALVVDAVRQAALNLCFSANDRAGLAEVVDPAGLMDMPPFIDTASYAPPSERPASPRCELVTVAMMRSGDKLASYRFLAVALARLEALDWRLTVVGDGPARAEVEQAFAPLPPDRLRYRGELPGEAVAAALREADLFVWPGFKEAFGLCYLEAAASGLPAVAVTGEGTPIVVLHERAGLLTLPDRDAYAAAMGRLMTDRSMRLSLGRAAHRFVLEHRSLSTVTARLDEAVRRATAAAPPARRPTDA